MLAVHDEAAKSSRLRRVFFLKVEVNHRVMVRLFLSPGHTLRNVSEDTLSVAFALRSIESINWFEDEYRSRVTGTLFWGCKHKFTRQQPFSH